MRLNYDTCKHEGCGKARFKDGLCFDHSGARHEYKYGGDDGRYAQRDKGVKLSDEEWERDDYDPRD